jgi:hypothetical protein
MGETNENFFIGLIIVEFIAIIAVIVLYFSVKTIKFKKKSKKRNEVDEEIENELKNNK